MKIMDYPLFIPPKELWGKKTIDWSYDEAKIYFKWFDLSKNSFLILR